LPPENAITTGADAAPITAPAVPANAAAASVRKAELLANAEWRGKYLENDPATRAEMTAINSVLVGPERQEDIDPSQLEHVRSLGIREEIVQQLANRMPIPQSEHDAVARWKAGHMKDPAFLRKYFDGDYEARQQMTIANIVLMSPIKQEMSK
jgi:hypothetical protein